jgi:probable rRNA maturation factor
MRPTLSLANRQRARRFDAAFILRLATIARPACVAAVRADSVPLSNLREVEATILSDRAIARVHDEFFSDPTPTDVITFHHGEILIGAGVVVENGLRYGHTPDEEAALCYIHGLLHLAGWDDHDGDEAKEMARMQEQIFKYARRMV